MEVCRVPQGLRYLALVKDPSREVYFASTKGLSVCVCGGGGLALVKDPSMEVYFASSKGFCGGMQGSSRV